MGPGSRRDLLSAVSFLICGQPSALGINLLDGFLAFASPFEFVPGWDRACVGSGVRVGLILSVGVLGGWWANSKEGALFCSVESFLDGSLLLLFFVLVLGLLLFLLFSFDGVSSSVLCRWRGESDLPVRRWGLVTDFLVVA